MIVDENIVFLFKQAGAKELLPSGAKADGDGIRSFLVPLDVEGDGWVLTPKRKRIIELPDALYRAAVEAAREAAEVPAAIENDYRDAMARGGGEFYATVFAYARFGQDSDFATTRAMCPRTTRVDPVFGKSVSDSVYETVHAVLIGAALAGAGSRNEIEAAGFVTVDDGDGMIRYFLPGMVMNYTPATIDLTGRDLSVWGFKTWMNHIRVSGTATVNDGKVVGLPSPRAGVRYAVTSGVYALSADRDDLVTGD